MFGGNLMTLRMITGASSIQKGNFILDEIKQELQRDPSGSPIFYIVPEQMTFQQETALFDDGKVKGSTRAQIVSFSRLAWRVLQEAGGSTKQFMSSTGTQMMLRKIIEQRVEGFHVFQKAADKQGFIQELDGMMTEFKRHCITPEMLQEQMHSTREKPALQHKLDDLYYIYAEMARLFGDKYMDGEDQLQLLAEHIPSLSLFQDATIYIDGFHRFTPKELLIISELLQKVAHVTVSLTLPSSFDQQETTEVDLFYQTKNTYQTILQTAKELDIPVLENEHPGVAYNSFADKPVMGHLEQYFDERPAPAYPMKEASPIQIKEAVHPRAEIEAVAQEIHRLIREENYRFQDMVMYMRDSETYNDIIQTVFYDYNIPVFMDEKQTMLNHPLVEFIRSLFDVVDSRWRYEAVFRLLKTGYIPSSNDTYPLTRDAIDVLENYVLEYGIRNKNQWLSEDSWEYHRFGGYNQAAKTNQEIEHEKRINAYRQQVVQALQQFDEKVKEATTVRERCVCLYLLIEELDISKQLEKERAAYDAQGEVEKAKEQEQVWDGVMQLLDEAVEMIGNEKLSLKLFQQTITAGLESLEFSHVPPTMDHVIVASIDHSRISGKSCGFLLGVNEGQWPMKPALDGMINEEERIFLEQFGLKLAASSRRVLLDDTFYMYLAFTSASDYLWVSYVLSDNEGKKKSASPMIQRLQSLFPNIGQPELLVEAEELYHARRFITTPATTRNALNIQLARGIKGYALDPIWQDVLEWFIQHETTSSTSYKVLQSLFYENNPVDLQPETVKELYPKHVKASVSRLEMLYRCSYQHFVQYHLKLQDRRTYKLDAPDIGHLFHEAIKTITEWIQEEGRSFASMTKDESKTYASKSVQHLSPAINHHILKSSNRYQYIQRKLEATIAKATYILSEQARLSGFTPAGIELSFGYDGGLDPVSINLPNGYEVVLRGRIDRVDEAIQHEQLYLRIIDYKSSARGLDLEDVYYGLALQMLTYLNVVLNQSKEWLGKQAEPAGVLYFHVHDAMLQGATQLKDEDIEEEIFKKYKMSGLISAEETAARLMDTSLTTGRSDIAPIGFKQNGDYYADSKVVGPETFDILKQHMENLIYQAGIHMTSGKVDLNPYENKEGIACTFCDFKSVCQFDSLLDENNFRKLTSLKENEVLERLRDLHKEENDIW